LETKHASDVALETLTAFGAISCRRYRATPRRPRRRRCRRQRRPSHRRAAVDNAGCARAGCVWLIPGEWLAAFLDELGTP